MPTLEEILNDDLGLGSEQSHEKVASQSEQDNSLDNDIEKLAMEVGLFGDQPENVDSELQETNKTGQTKEASMSLDNIYADLFPGDADVVGGTQEKLASDYEGLSKEAAIAEERLGELSYDYFNHYVDNHITKMAEELTGDATISAKDSDESEAPQTMANNDPQDSENAMDTTPEVVDHVSAEDGVPYTSGDEHQKKPAANVSHSELKEAAVRKHLLLAQLGQ